MELVEASGTPVLLGRSRPGCSEAGEPPGPGFPRPSHMRYLAKSAASAA